MNDPIQGNKHVEAESEPTRPAVSTHTVTSEGRAIVKVSTLVNSEAVQEVVQLAQEIAEQATTEHD